MFSLVMMRGVKSFLTAMYLPNCFLLQAVLLHWHLTPASSVAVQPSGTTTDSSLTAAGGHTSAISTAFAPVDTLALTVATSTSRPASFDLSTTPLTSTLATSSSVADLFTTPSSSITTTLIPSPSSPVAAPTPVNPISTSYSPTDSTTPPFPPSLLPPASSSSEISPVANSTLPIPTTTTDDGIVSLCHQGLVRSPCQSSLPGCIPSTYICNSLAECPDGLDEVGCTQVSSCVTNRVTCRDGSTCLETDQYCDGSTDCLDNSDEAFCFDFIAPACQNELIPTPCRGTCFRGADVCDSTQHCYSGRDERFCIRARPERCPRNRTACRRDSMLCVFNEVICNGINDCPDSSDEEFCNPDACPPGMVATPCSANFPDCISSSMICDGLSQCAGGEDEMLCAQAFSCSSEMVPCRTALPGVCISELLVCNGVLQDCSDGTDEFFCGSFQCPPDFMVSPCQDSIPGCIESSSICNLVSDCLDMSDESSCSNGSELFPFGSALGDTVVHDIHDEAIGPIDLTAPIGYFGQPETRLYISANGLISFRAPLTEPSPTAFPRETSSSSVTPLPLIAPFWTDLKFPSFDLSAIYFSHLESSGNANLSRFVDMVREVNPTFAGFEPSVVITVTWFHPRALTSMNLEQQIGAIQAILMSNGPVTFAAFLYADTDTIIHRAIGFDAGDGVKSATILSVGSEFNSSILSEANIFRIDGQCITLANFNYSCGSEAIVVSCQTSSLVADQCECSQVESSGTTFNSTTRTCEQDSDLNRCQEFNPCSSNAQCISVPNDVECICNRTGFTGDGRFFCQDIDECDSSANPCSQVCVNTIGSFNCSCQDGYMLLDDGFSCEDVNECETNPCGTNAYCINAPGTFTCRCDNLFAGNGFTCSVSETTIVSSVIVSVLLLIIATIVAVVFVCYRRAKRRLKYERRGSINEQETGSESGSNNYVYNLRSMTVRSSIAADVSKTLIIASCNLQIGKTIGQGEFGIVYKGLLKKGFSEGFTESVAVKTLKGFLQKENVSDLLKECVKMQDFNHPNILPLVGVCLDGGPAPYIVMPFMANGSLLAHLKKERETLIASPSDENMSQIQNKLLDMCVQVAKGMEYLASKRVIHRDLAARNCMIDVSFVIKVADFGLAESMDASKDYFRQDQESAIKLPVKWLAPESIDDGIFSEKTDVWAFGVTCWEVFSGGKAPYPGIHPLNLAQQLDSGYRMEKPINAACPEEMYMLMRSCWKARPCTRPTFSQLVRSLSSLLESMADYVDFLTLSNPAAAAAAADDDEDDDIPNPISSS